MIGQGARALTHEVRVTFRRARPHERDAAPPGYRVVVAIADTADSRKKPCGSFRPGRRRRPSILAIAPRRSNWPQGQSLPAGSASSL